MTPVGLAVRQISACARAARSARSAHASSSAFARIAAAASSMREWIHRGPRLSVVVPVYQAAAYLLKCLD
jgi:hypothetical protein